MIVNKHLFKEEHLKKCEIFILSSENLERLLNDPLHLVYGIKQKSGNLKEIITVDINSKLRLWMKPKGEYPYNRLIIETLEFISIDDKHYGEG